MGLVSLGWSGALATLTSPARAAACAERGGASPCVDSDPVWQRAGRRSFALAGPEATPPARALALGLGLGWVWHPLRLSVPSPEPDGRDVELVEQAWTYTLAVTAGLGRATALELALPTTLHQRGAGPEGLGSRRGPALAATAVRDPRVGLAVMALGGPPAGGSRPSEGVDGLALIVRAEVALPLGDHGAYASSGAWTAAPGATASWRGGRWYAALELSPRLRRGVALGETRVGSELWTSLGVGFELLDERRLGLGLEAWALPSLTAQRPLGAARPAVEAGTQLPAEWQLTLRSEPAGPGFYLLLGGGTGLPLSTATRVESTGARFPARFAGARAADVRAGLALGLQTATQ